MSWLSSLISHIPGGGAINSVAHNVVDPLARKAVGAIPGGGIALSLGDELGKLIPSPGGNSGGDGGGFSLSSLIDPALGGAALLNAASLGKQSTSFANDAKNTANQSYAERQPLRTAGVAGMMNPGAGINLGGLNSIAARNPFAKPAAPPAGGASLA